MAELVGQIIGGKYRLERLLGEGGMGAVYMGRHVVIGHPVAVKFLHASLADNEEVVRRFVREAQITAEIRHASIVSVLDVGVGDDGAPFLVMEYLEGESLSDTVARGPLDLPSACGVMAPVLRALQAAHDKGVVHRDLKPENIFLERRDGDTPAVKVIDFGISKLMGDATGTKLTRTGIMMGTPAYMSPEQARGAADVDHRTDLWALGAIFYELLTGRCPFEGDNFSEVLVKVLTEPPPDPAGLVDGFPEQARPVIDRALSKEAAGRYDSAAEMLAQIEQLAGLEQRVARLTVLGASLGDRHATGDLGAAVETPAIGSGTLAAELIREMAVIPDTGEPVVARRGPAGGWRDRRRLLVAVVGRLIERARRRPRVTAAIAVAAIALIALLIGLLGGTPDPGKNRVLITVEGAPSEARIFYEGALITENPFPVRKRDTIVPIVVKAEGYRTLKVSVVPSANKTVQVELERVPEEPAKAAGGGGGAGAEDKKSPKRRPAARKKKRRSKVGEFFDDVKGKLGGD